MVATAYVVRPVVATAYVVRPVVATAYVVRPVVLNILLGDHQTIINYSLCSDKGVPPRILFYNKVRLGRCIPILTGSQHGSDNDVMTPFLYIESE
ncbi:MAG: hypothetical protein JKX76_01150 [Colwellia sp.]|nr:hypothetical protein [Colwellia sp.]